MSTQIVVKIDPETKERLGQLAKAEGKSYSQIIRELIADYLRKQDMAAYIDDLWERVGRKLRERGITLADVDRAIREVRMAKHESSD